MTNTAAIVSHNLFDITTTRLVPVRISSEQAFSRLISRGLADPARLLASPAGFVQNINQIEREFGTASALAFGALMASGECDPTTIIECGKRIDKLFELIQSKLKIAANPTREALLKEIKTELWRHDPNRHSGYGEGDNYSLGKSLERYLGREGKVGDCVMLTLIDNLVLMKFGFEVSTIIDTTHLYSKVGNQTIENTRSDYNSAVRRPAPFELNGRVFNHFGLIAIIFNCRGNHLAAEGQFEAAEKVFNLAIALLPQYPTLYNNRANLYSDKKEWEKAEDDYNHALKLNPNSAYFYVNRGVTYAARGDHKKAMRDFEKAYLVDPGNPDLQEFFRRLWPDPAVPGINY